MLLDYDTPLNAEYLELRVPLLPGGFCHKMFAKHGLCFRGRRGKEHLQRLSHFPHRPSVFCDSPWKCSSPPSWETEQNVICAAEMTEFTPFEMTVGEGGGGCGSLVRRLSPKQEAQVAFIHKHVSGSLSLHSSLQGSQELSLWPLE